MKMGIHDFREPTVEKPRMIVICGPTGLGKTGLAIELAPSFRAEIISADSMQVYRYMDIGTAKATQQEQKCVRHHMIDILNPDEPFDAARYAIMARRIIANLHHKGVVPMVVGGTGFYIRALLYGLFQSRPTDPSIRKRLSEEVKRCGLPAFYRKLTIRDPDAAANIHPNDEFRIIRALEVMETTGEKLSSLHSAHRFSDIPYKVLMIGLNMDRAILYQGINRRTEEMVKKGLLGEVRSLLSKGYDSNIKAMQSIGYRHMVEFIEGRLTWDEAVRTLKRDTRRYAKRQLTWFRKDENVVWESPENVTAIRNRIEAFLQGS